MERLILNKLLDWKNSPYRKPLILKGVRQVGKECLKYRHSITRNVSAMRHEKTDSRLSFPHKNLLHVSSYHMVFSQTSCIQLCSCP